LAARAVLSADAGLLVNVYSKPAASSERTNYISELVKCLSQYYLCDGTNIIVGDMNYGDIDWVNLHAPSDSVQDVFLNFCCWMWLFTAYN